MGNCKSEVHIFRHDNDCLMSGCPSHKLELNYQSTSDYYSIYIDGELLFGCDRSTMSTILKAIKDVSYRYEVESDIKASKICELSNNPTKPYYITFDENDWPVRVYEQPLK